MRENPIMKYLAETYGITPEQLEEELKNAKIDIGIFVEPLEGENHYEEDKIHSVRTDSHGYAGICSGKRIRR